MPWTNGSKLMRDNWLNAISHTYAILLQMRNDIYFGLNDKLNDFIIKLMAATINT